MSGPGATEPALRRSWPHVRRVSRAAGLTLYAAVAPAGALLAPLPSLALGALFGVLGWAVVAGLHQVPDLPPLPHPAVAGIRMACLPAAVAGVTALGSPGGFVVAIGLAVSTGYLAHWASLPSAGSPHRVAGSAAGVDDEASLRELLGRLPLDVLEEEWRSARAESGAFHGSASDRERLRELLVDELLRRDPGRAGRWLTDGFDDPPGGTAGGRLA